MAKSWIEVGGDPVSPPEISVYNQVIQIFVQTG
jgi:hypothetical protein